MIFGYGTTMSKANQKLVNKGREVINEKVNGNDSEVAFSEQQETLHDTLANRPLGQQAYRRRLNARKFSAQDRITKKLFMENFFDLYKQSLLLDEDFISLKEDNLYRLCEDVFNNLIEENYTSWDDIKNNSSNFIQDMYALCEETAKKNAEINVTQDSVKKTPVGQDAIINEKEEDDKVDEDDKDDVDKKTKSSKKQVSKAIKNKVADTIKKEKESAEKNEEEDEEIKEKSKTKKEKESEEDDDSSSDDDSSEDDSTEDDDLSGEDDTEEDDDFSSDDDSSEDDSSDDDKKSSKKKKKSDESSGEDDTEEDDDSSSDDDSSEDDDEEKDDKKKSEAYIYRKKLRRPNKLYSESLFKSIQLNVSKKFLNESSRPERINEETIQLNMDMIFAESLAYYTLLETLNTTGIIKMRPSQIKQLSKELILK
jgi:hypothetical protein